MTKEKVKQPTPTDSTKVLNDYPTSDVTPFVTDKVKGVKCLPFDSEPFSSDEPVPVCSDTGSVLVSGPEVERKMFWTSVAVGIRKGPG